MSFLIETIAQECISKLINLIGTRPELIQIREPLEMMFKANEFQLLTKQAFQDFKQKNTLPNFFDEQFILQSPVQEALAMYVMEGKSINVEELTRRYRDYIGKDETSFYSVINTYMLELREHFAKHPSYGPILLARNIQSVYAVVNALRDEIRTEFQKILFQFDELRKSPDINAFVEPEITDHIFLSYTRSNLLQALKIRNALEDAGHSVWQDVSAIKTGEDWTQSIQSGIEHCYALVSIVSTDSLQSKWVKNEYLHAQRRGKPIFPIRIDNCEIPIYMLEVNLAQAYPNFDAGVTKLISDLSDHNSKDGYIGTTYVSSKRDSELRYLDKLLLEYSVWSELYTPMAGVGQLQKVETFLEKPSFITAPTDIATKFSLFIQEKLPSPAKTTFSQEDIEDISLVVEKVRQFVLLGDPGAGKTTTLWKIALEAIGRAKVDPSAPIPIIVQLGALNTELEVQIEKQISELDIDKLWENKRLIFLFDGLNELPSFYKSGAIKSIRKLVSSCNELDIVVVVTCRDLDYRGVLELGLPNRIVVKPLDPVRIFRFINSYIQEPKEAVNKLFWNLAGEYARATWSRFSELIGESFEVFWLADELPNGKTWQRGIVDYWNAWTFYREQHSRSLLQLATNPFMLYMITQMYMQAGYLPNNKGALFSIFIEFLLEHREKFPKDVSEKLQMELANLGYEMQKQGEGTSFNKELALEFLADTQNLYYAQSASLLTGDISIRFTHQLLQEYFAAKRLDAEMKAGTDAKTFFPGSNWWQPQGWEETVVLLSGFYSSDCSPVIKWLSSSQPELAARCILESGSSVNTTTLLLLQEHLLMRFQSPLEKPEARAAIARALGMLKLDNRDGIYNINNLPDISWCKIPAGNFTFGGDPDVLDAFYPMEQMIISLDYTWWMAKYPITCSQFAMFIEQGYKVDKYWSLDGLIWRGNRAAPAYWHDSYWNISNHPVIGVTWYEASAFTKWLNDLLKEQTNKIAGENFCIRLPTEAEWEKAARGTQSFFFAYGDLIQHGYANHYSLKENLNEFTGGTTYSMLDMWDEHLEELKNTHSLDRTSAVGVYFLDQSDYGICDLSGNISEWCLSKWNKVYSFPEDTTEDNSKRALRGGAWPFNSHAVRLASRGRSLQSTSKNYIGFRVCLAPKLE